MTAWKNLAIITELVRMESPTTRVLALLVTSEVTASIVCLDVNIKHYKPILFTL